MNDERFVGGPCGFYDRYTGNRWLWTEWEEVMKIMNNLDTKARERSKALSKLQHENTKLRKEKNSSIKDYLHFKRNLLAAIHNERTDMGKSVLKQFADKVGVKYE